MFTVSWPLILGLLSGSIMMFADRVFLGNYDLAALNAAANAGMAFFSMFILPMVIASISEVFVGRLNGEGQKEKVGEPVWQMIWFSLMTIPFFTIGGRLLVPLFSYGSANVHLEADYFILSCDFGVFWTLTGALIGFYVGLGRPQVVMVCTFAANLLNILLDYLLIFGIWIFPEMGVKGAALATGIAMASQTLFFGLGFLSSKSRATYKTQNFAFDWPLFSECIRIGVPAGLGRFMEVIAHTFFFRIISYTGELQMTIVAMVQSIYVLISFSSEGLCKAVTAIASNLIGAKRLDLVGRVIRSAMVQHTLVTFAFALILYYGLRRWCPYLFPNQNCTCLRTNCLSLLPVWPCWAWVCSFGWMA